MPLLLHAKRFTQFEYLGNMEKSARIVKIHGEIATVIVKQQNACSVCSVNSLCGTSVLSSIFTRKAEFDVINEAGAKVGDEVYLEISDAVLIKASIAMYLLPILFLLAGAIIGEKFLYTLANAEVASIIGGVTGFFLGILFYKSYSKRLKESMDNTPISISQSQQSCDS